MARLTFFRHAQGSILGPDYDVLSPIGIEQAGRVGACWRGQVAHVFVGPARRHRDTQRLAAAQVRGTPWPAAQVLEDLDEHDAKSLVRGTVAKYGQDEPQLLDMVAAIGSVDASRDQRSAAMQRLFEHVMRGWLAGEYVVDGVDPWPVFRDRVRAGLEAVQASVASGEHALIFSSVGPFAAVLESIGHIPALLAFATAWRLRNAARSDLLVRGQSITLDSFNGLAHLPDPRLWTHR